MHAMKAVAVILLGFLFNAPRQSSPAVVEMTREMSFMPKALSVMVGEIVVWKNVAKEPHSVNTIPENCRHEDSKQWIKIPPGATPFFSGEVKPGEEWRARFEIPGTYQYVCTFHEHGSMRGTIIVEGAGVK
jgi:plastocyanin